jgi:glutathione peroxidase
MCHDQDMSLLDTPIATLTGEPSTLGALTGGKATLVVNVASKCGLTPQYTALEKLASQGISVVGFPCNQFGGQEPGTAEEIGEFCSATYGVSFPLTEKVDVNGSHQHPIYAELTAAADSAGDAGEVQWNFEKFVLSPSGEIVGRFRPQTQPDDPAVLEALERASA